MKLTSRGMFVFFMSIFMLTACSTTTKVDKLDSDAQARDKSCEIQFFKDEQPGKNYETIGKIESHIKKNVFFGGAVQLEDEAYEELRAKACGLGGEAVIIDDSIETSASEMTHVHVWATVIEFTD